MCDHDSQVLSGPGRDGYSEHFPRTLLQVAVNVVRMAFTTSSSEFCDLTMSRTRFGTSELVDGSNGIWKVGYVEDLGFIESFCRK